MSSKPSTLVVTNGRVQSSPPASAPASAGHALDAVALGDVMFRSGLFPDLRSAAQAVVKILAGRELGVGPFAALSDIHIIEGKAVVGARILAALVRGSRHYDYRVVEWTNERVAVDFYRDGTKLEPTVTFDYADAQRAELTKPTRNGRPSNHTRYPRHMKFARAMSTGVGLHCPDLTAGVPVYTPGELEADPVAGSAPVAQQGEGAARELTIVELLDVGSRCGYHARTVVALARFYHQHDDLRALNAKQRAHLARRLTAARARGIAEGVLVTLAVRGSTQPDRAKAIAAADAWLRGTGEGTPPKSA
jgi:hypothetical protein